MASSLLTRICQDLTPIDLPGSQTKLDISPYVAQLRAMVPHVRSEDQLREAVRLFGTRLGEIESQGTISSFISSN